MLCKLEDLCLKTKKIDRKTVQKKVFLLRKKKNLPSFSNTMEESRPKGKIYIGPQGLLTVIV